MKVDLSYPILGSESVFDKSADLNVTLESQSMECLNHMLLGALSTETPFTTRGTIQAMTGNDFNNQKRQNQKIVKSIAKVFRYAKLVLELDIAYQI